MAQAVDIRGMEKAELHCHIDGLLDVELLDELHRERELLGLAREDLRAVTPVTSIKDWTDRYGQLVEPHLQPFDRVLPIIVEHHVRRLQQQNVIYAELLVNRLLAVRDSSEATLELFRELRARVDRVSGPRMRVVFVVCVGRRSRSRLERQLERILALARAGLIRGIAIAGNEGDCTIAELGGSLNRLRAEGLGIEIHAGEFLGIESVIDALDHGRPRRLGHAVAAFADPLLLERIAAEHVHLEFCPSSNLRLGVVERIEDHPIRVARALGLPFSINTDDPGPFGCSMTTELTLVHDAFGFTQADFERILHDTLAARFE